MLPISSWGDPVDPSWRGGCLGCAAQGDVISVSEMLPGDSLQLASHGHVAARYGSWCSGFVTAAGQLLLYGFSSFHWIFRGTGFIKLYFCPLHGFPDKRWFETGKNCKKFPQNFLIFLHSAQSDTLCFREIRFPYLCGGIMPLIFLILLWDFITVSKINPYIALGCDWWTDNLY